MLSTDQMPTKIEQVGHGGMSGHESLGLAG